jgi:hypothetical protein
MGPNFGKKEKKKKKKKHTHTKEPKIENANMKF